MSTTALILLLWVKVLFLQNVLGVLLLKGIFSKTTYVCINSPM